jgi:hypothetical protein
MNIPLFVQQIFELLSLGFFVGAPILIISAIGQWVIQFRLIPEHNVPHLSGLRCILYTQITTYILSLIIWVFWPIDPQLIMYNNRISIPTVIGEFIAIPLWMKRYGYFNQKIKD